MLITNYIVLSGGSYLFDPFFSSIIFQEPFLLLPDKFIRTCFWITKLSSPHSYHNPGYQIQKASEIMILEREIREVQKEIRKIPYPGQFYGSQISCGPIINLTHMVAVYIIILDIIIKLIRTSVYFRRRPLSFKFIYLKIIQYLLYNLIVFYRCNYPHIPTTSGTICRVLQYGECLIKTLY